MSKQFTPADLPLIDTYEWDKEAKDMVAVQKRPTGFVDEYGTLCVSAEEGDGFADYYGEFHDGYPHIDPALEEWAAQSGQYWEWKNPGCIALYNV